MPDRIGQGLIERIRSEPRLAKSEEAALIERFRRGDRHAATRLVMSHLRFVVHTARRYRRHGTPLNELVQEGTIGLIEALRRFNPERNVRLSTYAGWWIRAAMQAHVVRSLSLVRVGTTGAQRTLLSGVGRRLLDFGEAAQPSEEMVRNLAERLNISVSEILALARRLSRPDQSLHVRAGPEDRELLIDRMVDDAPTPEEHTVAASERRHMLDLLGTALAHLSPREKLVIYRRFLAEHTPSRAALGRELGVSKERVRQLEERALKKLRLVFEPGLKTARGTARA